MCVGQRIKPGSHKWETMWRKPEETKGKETEGNTGQQGRGDPWRSQYRDVKGKAETKYLKRMRRLRGRSHNSREMTKEEHEVPESSTRGNLGLRAGDTRTLRS